MPIGLEGRRLVALLLPLVLTACGGGSGEGATPTRQEVASAETAPKPSLSGSPTEVSTADQGDTAEAGPASSSPRSCAADIGAAAAAALVKQCRNVSPATRPPCNAANSCALVRDEIARGCAFLADDARAAGCVDPEGSAAATDVVRRLYDAVNAGDLSTAFAQWGDEGRASGHSFEAFAAGYRDTRSVRVTPGEPSRIEGAAGSRYMTLPVTVDAVTAAGRRQRFTGTYLLRRVAVPSAPLETRRWHIESADLTPAGG